MVAALKDQGLSSEWYYTTSTNRDDKSISMGGTQPDTGRNVHGLKNTVSLLVETRGVGIGRLHAQRRVHAQVVAMTSALRSASEKWGPWNRFAPLSSKTHLPRLAVTKSS